MNGSYSETDDESSGSSSPSMDLPMIVHPREDLKMRLRSTSENKINTYPHVTIVSACGDWEHEFGLPPVEEPERFRHSPNNVSLFKVSEAEQNVRFIMVQSKGSDISTDAFETLLCNVYFDDQPAFQPLIMDSDEKEEFDSGKSKSSDENCEEQDNQIRDMHTEDQCPDYQPNDEQHSNPNQQPKASDENSEEHENQKPVMHSEEQCTDCQLTDEQHSNPDQMQWPETIEHMILVKEHPKADDDKEEEEQCPKLDLYSDDHCTVLQLIDQKRDEVNKVLFTELDVEYLMAELNDNEQTTVEEALSSGNGKHREDKGIDRVFTEGGDGQTEHDEYKDTLKEDLQNEVIVPEKTQAIAEVSEKRAKQLTHRTPIIMVGGAEDKGRCLSPTKSATAADSPNQEGEQVPWTPAITPSDTTRGNLNPVRCVAGLHVPESPARQVQPVPYKTVVNILEENPYTVAITPEETHQEIGNPVAYTQPKSSEENLEEGKVSPPCAPATPTIKSHERKIIDSPFTGTIADEEVPSENVAFVPCTTAMTVGGNPEEQVTPPSNTESRAFIATSREVKEVVPRVANAAIAEVAREKCVLMPNTSEIKILKKPDVKVKLYPYTSNQAIMESAQETEKEHLEKHRASPDCTSCFGIWKDVGGFSKIFNR
ncbi:uncharacterized protein [Ambystoma mexicanum]|uniref:uncharacterized protein isoform X2 n=1 Tax=Ambystoma mexicanum TaxID=8296 RepID=UPI0037E85B0E